MAILTREQILEARDMRVEKVKVPEWGGEVFVRSLTAAERDDFEGSIVTRDGSKLDFSIANIRAKLVARTVCDEAGNRIFTDADILLLGEKSAEPVDRIYDVAQRLSGLSDKDMEELEKNSGTIPGEKAISD
jgi:hypothetical protein